MAPEDSTVVAVALARIEGKLDRLGDSISGLSVESLDHEQRLRRIEARPPMSAEVDERLRAIEARACVTPKQLAAWLGLSLTAVSTAAPFIIFSLR